MLGQTENYKTAIDNFQENYNRENYESIFNSFSPEMKQALPLDKTVQFLNGLKSQVGKISSKEFSSFEQNTYASYKATFEKAVLAINISLDSQNQINGLLVKAYEEPKSAANTTINILDSYPPEISKIIFSKSQNFPDNTQISIAVIAKGKTSYYGIIKVNNNIKPIENQNKNFEIGSITKVFTSTVLSSLIQEGQINLNDEVNTYYPFNFKNNERITFKTLANHTSGLPRLPENLDLSNESNPYKDYGKEEIEEYLKNLLNLQSEPSKTYSYSNLGAGLLGYTIGLSQNMTFPELLQKKIFDKYKMKNSFTTSENLGNKLIKGLDTQGKVITNWDFDALFGGGGIVSTTEDLAKFAEAHFNLKNKELAMTRKATFDIDENMKIGLGWHILKSTKRQELFWHNGGTGGYSSSMVINVNSKTAVIILSNVSAFNPEMENIDKLCFELMTEIDK